MGSRQDAQAKAVYAALPVRSYADSRISLPATFDERDKWPKCTIMQEIRDQASCGSCWAFGTVEGESAVVTCGAEANTMMSAQDVTSCCSGFTCFGCQGCNGGMPPTAWQFLTTKGVVTGGDYNTNGTCRTYEIPPCEHHVKGPRPDCKEGGATPACTSQCDTGYSVPYAKDKHMAKSVYSLNSVADIQQDIYQYGAVTAAFSVYEDFLSYKSGVYKHVTGSMLGGHAISIIGWGTESGTDYWLVRNSWNTDWGANGYFKIARGVDECGIEDEVVAGDV
ncbi:CTSB [Symbiodinium sp. KB8]|nr:CTSB [Symbiodinium sp. KB8]